MKCSAHFWVEPGERASLPMAAQVMRKPGELHSPLSEWRHLPLPFWISKYWRFPHRARSPRDPSVMSRRAPPCWEHAVSSPPTFPSHPSPRQEGKARTDPRKPQKSHGKRLTLKRHPGRGSDHRHKEFERALQTHGLVCPKLLRLFFVILKGH